MNQVKIWTLGAVNTSADREISWSGTMPNYADSDILIIDLSTLTRDRLSHIDKKNYHITKEAIMDKCRNGGKIIFITAPYLTIQEGVTYTSILSGRPPQIRYFPHTNYDLSPISLNTKEVPEGEGIVYDKHGITENPFLSYLSNVKKFKFYLTELNYDDLSAKDGSVSIMADFDVKDKSGHILGRVFEISSARGQVIFLPPPTLISTSDAINKIIEKLRGGSNSKETQVPNWTNDLIIPTLNEKQEELSDLELKRNSVNEEIQSVESQIQELKNYTRLLYADGFNLEDTVYDAFEILGFDIKKIKSDDLEDGTFEFKNVKDFELGVIEIKGSEKRTSLANLTQCNKWVENYMIENRKVKGIFICNQYRLNPYPKSKDDRIRFEPNELDYADTRRICVMPSFVLFEAVKSVLSGNVKTIANLEEIIAKTNGVLLNL